MASRSVTNREQQSLNRSTVSAYVCIFGALTCVLLMGLWGLQRDLTQSTSTMLQSVTSRLRSQAMRRARHLESRLTSIEPGATLQDLRDDSWFEQYWAGVTPLREEQLYAAIVDMNGTVVFHSDPSLEGKQLSRHWYNRVVDEVGNDVVESRKNMLASGLPSYDVHVPLMAGGEQIGEYHEGLSKHWVDQRFAGSRSLIWRRWTIVIGAILSVILFSVVALYYMGKRAIKLQQAVAMAHVQRVTEVGQLAAGLAHEIRNPLHAIQLNLHTLRRAKCEDMELEPADVEVLIHESQAEIDRIDQLMRELLGYASPEHASNEDFNICDELNATLAFLSNELTRSGIDVDSDFPREAVIVHIDKTRFRQVMLNLLLNAKDAMPEGGTIHLSLRHRPRGAEILVSDEGPGVPQQDAERIFDPFYTTKPEGTGFGLAIAKRFITEAGGSIACTPNGRTGAIFRLTLPMDRQHDDTGAKS